MKKKDFILALLVVIVWGANFTVIKLGLNGVPSMLLVALRYLITAFPAVFFIKKPNTEWKYIILYGLAVGVGQFSCLFYAMEIGMPAGLASIIVQLQGFISPIFAYMFLHEKLKPKQIIGILIAGVGLYVIGTATEINGISAVPLGALLLTIGAPVFWSLSNIVARFASQKTAAKGEKLDMFGLVVWSSLIPPLPLLIMAFMLDSPNTIYSAIANMNGMSIFAVLYLAFGATVFGYGVWNYLIAKYPMGKIAPLSLMVPVTGLFTAGIVLSEELSKLQQYGVAIILFGLLVTNIDFKAIINRFNKFGVKG